MPKQTKRIFNRAYGRSGKMEWFFRSSEGLHGPFISEKEATVMLTNFLLSVQEDGPSMITAEDPSTASQTAFPLLGDLTRKFWQKQMSE